MFQRTIESRSGSEAYTQGDLLEQPSVAPASSAFPSTSAIPLNAVSQAPRPELFAVPSPPAQPVGQVIQLQNGTRLRDIGIAMVAVLFFAPLMLLVALAVFVTSPGPVLFRHSRVGYGGRPFNCLKFRTMRMNACTALEELFTRDPAARAEWERTYKLERDPRLSSIGGFLRRTSLDELPQLLNVLAGDMSIVGPRPIVAEEAHRYGHYFSSYCAVKPGITGLWQINGRSRTTYRRRVACDVSYVRTRSAYRDALIIACTIPAVLLGRGAC